MSTNVLWVRTNGAGEEVNGEMLGLKSSIRVYGLTHTRKHGTAESRTQTTSTCGWFLSRAAHSDSLLDIS